MVVEEAAEATLFSFSLLGWAAAEALPLTVGVPSSSESSSSQATSSSVEAAAGYQQWFAEMPYI